MPRYSTVLLTLATLSATAVVCLAQSANPAGPDNFGTTQSQPAPIVRANPPENYQGNDYQGNQGNSSYGNNDGARNPRANRMAPSNYRATNLATGETLSTTRDTATAQIVPGVFLRIGQRSVTRVVAASADRTELRVERGVANISVHQPEKNALILVDLPGGQTDLIKDGLYTFNAQTNTMRVLKGEADAFPGSHAAVQESAAEKPLKVKEDHQVVFNGPSARSTDSDFAQVRSDLVPFSGNDGHGDRGLNGGAPYGDGFAPGYPYYGSPYYAYGDPYGWGYPYYGYGYPFGFGLGFGYGGFGYGGFGGFHGGFGGFHGRR